MPLPKIDDARNLSDQELADEILAAKRQLFELRMQKATRRLEKTHQFKHLRHRVAQMMTVIRERELAAQAEAKASATDVKEPTATQAPAEASPADAQESTGKSTPAQATAETPQPEAKEEE